MKLADIEGRKASGFGRYKWKTNQEDYTKLQIVGSQDKQETLCFGKWTYYIFVLLVWLGDNKPMPYTSMILDVLYYLYMCSQQIP